MSELACLAYGAGTAAEGVCLLLQLGPYKVLLDCGLSPLPGRDPRSGTANADATEPDRGSVGQESRPWAELASANLGAIAAVDVVLCSHAHADHACGLWEFHQRFPKTPIYATEVTNHLLPLNWPTAWQGELGLGSGPFFCRALPWRSPLEILPGLTVTLYPAGHLPGAAAILLTCERQVDATPDFGDPPEHLPARPYTVFYTGDFFLSNTRLVDGLPLEELRGLAPDVLIVEGSYGTARVPHRRQQENRLAEQIQQALSQGKSVLLPTGGLGVAQELLMLLRSHYHFTGQPIDIWVDEPIAAGCDAYLGILPQLPTAVQNFARHQPLFWDEKVRPCLRRLPSHGVQNCPRPCIVLVDFTADLTPYLRPSQDQIPWQILYPQQPGDRPLLSPDILNLANAEPYLLAQHCDGLSTMQLIHNLRPQHVLFVHGAPEYLQDLASLEELSNRYQLHIPIPDQWVDLPVGEAFVRASPPETRYEAELSEDAKEVVLRIPREIAADPRWQLFADTGLVEMRWQGSDVVLRGISQQELLQPPEEESR